MGRPQDEAANSAMDEMYKFIESSDHCQFTLDELKNFSKNLALNNRTIKIRLKVKYSNKIIITEKPEKLTFICFVDNYQDILSQAWYDKNLKAAAAIVRYIQSCVFDNTVYPPPSRMFENINNDIPESLSYFFEQIILNNKRHNLEHSKLVCTNISHSIMTAVRPRSFKSKLQLGHSVFSSAIWFQTSDTNLLVFWFVRIL